FDDTIANIGTYSITRSSGLSAPAATQTWNAAHTLLTLTFATPFVEGERVTFTISGYSDTAGNVQPASTSILFDTIDTTAPPLPVLASSDPNNKIREGTSVTILAAV